MPAFERARTAAFAGRRLKYRIATEFLFVLVLILANGIFAMSEMAVVAARKVRLQQRADDGDERAKAALELANDPAQFLSTVQVGITLVGILAGAYGGATIAERWPPDCGRAGAGALRRGRGARPGRGRDHLPVAGVRRARAEEHRPDQPRDDRLVGRPSDDGAGTDRRPVRGAAHRALPN